MKANMQADLLLPTNEDTVGPYFPINFSDPLLEDLSQFESGITAQPQGVPIILKGRLLDRYGELANGTVVEFWQANDERTKSERTTSKSTTRSARSYYVASTLQR